MITKTYEVRIEAGALCEVFTVTAKTKNDAAYEAYEAFNKTAGKRLREIAEVTGITEA